MLFFGPAIPPTYPQTAAKSRLNSQVFPPCRFFCVCYAARTTFISKRKTNMKTSEAFEPFISFCQAERHAAPSTVAKYRDCFDSWLRPWLGEKGVSEITRLLVLELRQAMVDKQLSIARQYSVIMCLKSFLKFCRSTLGLSCLDPLEIKLPKRPAPHVEYLTNTEIQQVLDAIDTHTLTGIRLRALIEVILSTGMRISEALSLKRIQFDSGSIEAEIIGKGKRKRTVFFSQRCRFWVQQYLDRRLDDDPAVFATTGYPVRKLAREDVSRFFVNLKAKAGITKKFTPHILRHTFCTILRNNGADISHIKDLAGHQDIQTTARYYLGKDKNVLRRVVATCLDYGTRDYRGELDPVTAVLPKNDQGRPMHFSVDAQPATSGLRNSVAETPSVI
jgi:integrase/recombinase XerD